MKDWNKCRYWPVLAVFFASFLIYSLTLTQHYRGDGLAYLTGIERNGVHSASAAHKLLNALLLSALKSLLVLLGYQGHLLIAAQLKNAFIGAGAVALVFASVRELSGSLRMSLSLSAVFAFSAAHWYASTDTLYVADGIFWIAVSIFIVIIIKSHVRTISGWPSSTSILLGMSMGLAVLGYMGSLFVALSAVLPLYLDNRGQGKRKGLAAAGIYLVSLGAILTMVLFIVGVANVGCSTLPDLIRWVMKPAEAGSLREAVNFRTDLSTWLRFPKIFADGVATKHPYEGTGELLSNAPWIGLWTDSLDRQPNFMVYLKHG
jgi:hypothetical protein